MIDGVSTGGKKIDFRKASEELGGEEDEVRLLIVTHSSGELLMPELNHCLNRTTTMQM